MRIRLIDVDSVTPNLALMKWSAYFKSRGDQVGFDILNPDAVKMSVVFKQNRDRAIQLAERWPDVEIGGTGWDLFTRMPDRIERVRPDYSLYDGMVCQRCNNKLTVCRCGSKRRPGNIDFSMGFTTRGCIRSCHFCVVPEKEGNLTRHQHPREFHDPRFNRMMLFDNNWLADRSWFFETSEWIIQNKIRIREGGMDIRLVDAEIARRIKQIKFYKPKHFAFDSEDDEAEVLKGIEILQQAGINTKSDCSFFVYLDSDDEYDSAVRRCRLLKAHRTAPFVMFNMDNEPTKRVQKLKHWANRPQIFWSTDISDYSTTKKVVG